MPLHRQHWTMLCGSRSGGGGCVVAVQGVLRVICALAAWLLDRLRVLWCSFGSARCWRRRSSSCASSLPSSSTGVSGHGDCHRWNGSGWRGCRVCFTGGGRRWWWSARRHSSAGTARASGCSGAGGLAAAAGRLVPGELQARIADMARENPTWSARRIQKELLLKLGIRAAGGDGPTLHAAPATAPQRSRTRRSAVGDVRAKPRPRPSWPATSSWR